MRNKEIADIFFEMVNLLELAEENRFRIRAYTNAAQTISDLSEDVEKLIETETLTELPGIGEGFAEKIKEYCRTGKVKEYEKLKTKFPSGLLEMMMISGLGPKRVRFLFKKKQIDSIEKLTEAAKKGMLRELEGFGPKIEENILKGIAAKESFSKRMLISDAMRIAQDILQQMHSRCGRSLEKLEIAGSLRRWKESVGDLDFLCVSRQPKEVIGQFTAMPGILRILAQGETKASIIHQSGAQCDLRVVPPESFGAAMLYFTGSKEHNVALRELALKKGFTTNEYGLYSLKNKSKAVAGKTEEEIYAKLGMQFVPPELRENRGEIEAALKGRLPKLIEEKDILGDFHNHTKLSDGINSLEEMAEKARKKGWQWFVSGDHSQSLKVARGLSPETLLRKKNQIEKLNKLSKNFRIFLGSEVDILSDGELDYDTQTLKQIDFVVASVHTGFKQSEEQLTGRILDAERSPQVDIIGHLTGRLINRRESYPVNVQKILTEASRTGTAIEINGQPERMELSDYHAKNAAEAGVMIALSTDAHSIHQLDFMTFAVATARRAWLTKENVLNCLDSGQLVEWKEN